MRHEVVTTKKVTKSGKPKMSLSQWIDQMGVPYVSELLDVAESCVRHWRSGHAIPTTQKMRFIKNFTQGVVGYDEMIDQDPQRKSRG